MHLLRSVVNRLRIPLSPSQIAAFDVYRRELVAAGARAGLTALRDPEAIDRRHFGEPLALLRALDDAGCFGSPAIDIGTGAGFPGLPIKIARPDLRLTLLEATGKKIAFLRRTVELLRLDGVTVIQGRAEEIAHDPAHRAAYALALARAVAPLRVLVELALPFVQMGGVLATPKGSAAPREAREAAAALAACGGRIVAMTPLEVPAGAPAPTLVIVRKVAPTPDRYPRRVGIPSRRPL